MKIFQTVFLFIVLAGFVSCGKFHLNDQQIVHQLADFSFSVSPTRMDIPAGTSKTGKINAWPANPGDWVDIRFENIPSGVQIKGGGKFYYPGGKNKDYIVSIDPSVSVSTYRIDVVATDKYGNEDYESIIIKALAPLPGTQLWVKQFGTDQEDVIAAMLIDAKDNIIIAGSTKGSLYGTNTMPNLRDVFIAKYKPDGTALWTKQFGTSDQDGIIDIAIDGSDNIIILGDTAGSLFKTSTGGADVFIVKYGPDGTEHWHDQFGSGQLDGWGGYAKKLISINTIGDLVITGITNGSLFASNPSRQISPFIVKYSSSGTRLWGKQLLGTKGSQITVSDIYMDRSGDVAIIGMTFDDLFGSHSGIDNTYVAKYTSDGGLLWGQQLTATSKGYGVTIDSLGNVISVGNTTASIFSSNAGRDDVIITKYSFDGKLLWGKQFGTTIDDNAINVSTDLLDNIVVIGSLGPMLSINPGTFIVKYTADGALLDLSQFDCSFCGFSLPLINAYRQQVIDKSGALASIRQNLGQLVIVKTSSDSKALWSKRFGTGLTIASQLISTDSADNIIVAGAIKGSLFATSAGLGDVFIAKYKK